MGKFVKGDIVVVKFPFTDLTGAKRRPALVVAELQGDDVILCQITGTARTDKYAVSLNESDYINGRLSVASVIRPNRVFTASENIINYKVCEINDEKRQKVTEKLLEIIE
jgi:mRNA interferase MazF